MKSMIGFIRNRVSEKRYQDLRRGLRGARIAKTPDRYLSTSMTLSIVAGLLASAVGPAAISRVFGIPLAYAAPLAIPLALGCGYGCYRAFLGYPGSVAKERGKKIDDMLPHATAFLLAMSKGGAGATEMFRALGERGDEYGEISKEAGAIVRGVECLGYSPPRAITDVAETTPSEKLRELLRPLVTIVETGANAVEFLSDRCELYYSDAKERQARAIDQLTTYTELSVMLLGLVPFLALIVWIFIGMIQGGFDLLPIQMLVYMGIPVGSALCIALLDKFSRPEVKRKKWGAGGPEAPKGMAPEERALLRRLARGGVVDRIRLALGTPVRVFSERPTRILWASVPLGAISASLCFAWGFAIETAAVFGMLISLPPFIIFHEIRKRRVRRITEAVPSFLISLSAAVSSGLSPSRAIRSFSPARFGALAPEVERMKRDLEWGGSITEALRGFESRVRSGLLSRVISVMERASKAAAKIGDVLKVLATDVSTEVSMRRERAGKTFTHIAIIYLIFVMFLVGLGSMAIYLAAAPGAVAMGTAAVVPIDVESIRLIFFHAILIQGFCMGLLAGKFRTGSILDGLKHSVAMTSAGWLLFLPLITHFAIPAF